MRLSHLFHTPPRVPAPGARFLADSPALTFTRPGRLICRGGSIMKVTTTLTWLGIGLFSAVMFTDNAFADSRRNRREFTRDRAELHKDLGELKRDKAELRRDVHRGAPRSEIARDRAEIR